MEKSILKNINLKINKGEFVAVMGANGCGKTTLAKHINGLLLPTSGNVFVKNMDTDSAKNHPIITKTVSLTFQNPDDQFVASTVEEEIAFGLENICYPSNKMRLKISETLDFVGLSGLEMRTINSISEGQKQKLSLACSLAIEPEVMVLDEITSMLDPVSQKNILKIILDLHRNQKMTIVLITHDINVAVFAQKLVFIEDGEVKLVDKPENIFADLDLMRKYNIIPMKSTILLKELQKLGFEIELRNSLKNILCAREIVNILENGYV